MKAFEHTEQHFGILFDQAGVGVALLDTSTGSVKRANQKYREILGFSAAESPELDFMSITHPDDLAQDLAQMERLRRGEIRAFSMEKRLLRKDGTPVWVDLTVSANWPPGEPPATHIAVVVDISERKRAQEKTALARAELESTLEALPDLLFDADDEGRIYDYRARADSLLAVPPAAFLGRTIADVLPPDVCAVLMAAIAETMANGRVEGALYKLHIAGVERWFEMSMARKATTSGRPRLIAISRDVTDRVVADERRTELEAQLRQSQKMEAVGTLAGGIAHDFNNLLTVIGLNAEVVQSQLPPDHQARESLAAIHLVVGRAERLIQQILAFSRKAAANRVVLSLNDAVVEAANFLRAMLPAGVELKITLAHDSPRCKADATQLQQVLVNLGTNAWQAMARGHGTITFETGTARAPEGHAKFGNDSYAWLRVSDDGVGMPEEIRLRIFEPFFTTRAPGKGSGLGLSVVHGIVEEHGGTIKVETRPGHGTTFEMHLAAEESASQAPGPERAAVPGGGGRVLYVDDETMIHPGVVSMLKRLGYEASALSDPREALAAVRSRPRDFDLVVTDLSMPGLSGIDLARELTAVRPDLPVVMVSGYFTHTDEELAAAGVRRRLAKPFDIQAMSEAIRSVLRRG